MSEIKLHITIKDGHLMAIGSQGCDTATMTTNNINRLTIKKIVSFMEFYINQTDTKSKEIR
jgi:hypothetical protein